jgi:conjugal transfer mating pair stabilization protein TraG
MGTWTIYTAGADLTLLNAILNGVAMVCSQTAFVWGFASLASLWLFVSTSTAGTVRGLNGGAGEYLSKGGAGALVPLVLAMLLTTPGAMCTVQVESTLTNAVTVVNNVPFVVVAIPVAGSQMAASTNQVVKTAFSNANPDYDTISSTGNGFLDPMKRLLGARTTVQRLNGIDSEIRTVVSSCLGSDSGVNYSALDNAVVNAGNTGATAAQSIPIYGATPTAIGALLYQASQNATGVVLNITNGNSQQILSCHDGALQVQADIDTALSSPEFVRTVQGAVNGMDQPQATADYSIDRLEQEVTALRKWSSVAGNLAGGQQQANAETINFLFAEEVANALNCLQADSSDKTICEASMIQANEVERNNIQAAANEVPMLQYAGSFGNYIMALIIGLGPVIVMFMMFAGVNADKCIKTAAHIMVWPLLVTNVGAELVNAMISMQFANFMASLAHGGYLSLATMNSAYKELSLQVGTASHIMASLPVLMSMIFALGEGAALVSVANDLKPSGREVSENLVPTPTASAPLTREGTPVNIAQGVGFSRVQALGALDAVSGSAQFGSLARETSRSISDAETRQHTLSEGKTLLSAWEHATQSGNYSRWGLSHNEGEALREVYEKNLRASQSSRTGHEARGLRQNSNVSSVGVHAGAGASTGAIPLSASAGADANTQTEASDSKSSAVSSSRDASSERASALNKTLNSEVATQLERSHGGDLSSTFRHAQSVARNYQELTSKADSHTDTTQQALKVGSNLVAASQKIGGDEIAYQLSANRDYQRFQLSEGHKYASDPTARKYLQQAERDMADGATDSLIGNDPARQALLRQRAAMLQYADESASPEQRLKGLKFLADGARAMTHIAFTAPKPGEFTSPAGPIGKVSDSTGAHEGQLIHHPIALSRAPATLPGIEGDREFRHDVVEDASDTTDQTEVEVNHDMLDADHWGLGQDGSGTVVRVGKNIAGNVRSAMGSASASTPVTFGDLPSETDSGSSPEPAASAGSPERQEH